MKQLLTIIAALTMVTGVSVYAQQSGQQAPPAEKPQPKTEAKTPPSIAGKWNMTVNTEQGAMAVVLELKLDGKKLTGTLTSDRGETALEGEYADGKLSFAISFQGGGGEMTIGFSGALKEDGTLAGTMDFGQGQMAWKAERPKT
jgi:hypothetical protein